MDIIQILKEDYQRFPVNQTYSIYAKDVFCDILSHQIKDYGVSFQISRLGIPSFSLTGFRL
jgi:hypothetical protein